MRLRKPSTRRTPPAEFPVPEWSPTPSEAAHYLAAMIDGEGHVDYRPAQGRRTSPNRRILIVNTEPEIIGAVLSCCAILDISAYTYVKDPPPPRRRSWEINITGQRSLRLAAALPIRSPRKADTVRAIVASYTQSPQGSGRHSGSWPEARQRGIAAYRMHADEGLSWSQIGFRLGFSAPAACSGARRAAEAEGWKWPLVDRDPAAMARHTAEVLRLRAEGLSWPAVGKRLGVTDAAARATARRARLRAEGPM